MRNMFAPPAGILGDQEEAVRQQMQMQGLLGLAAGLFQAGTPSRTPQSLGGSALQGLMAGQQMAQGTFDQTLKAMQLRQQMADAAEKRKREQQFREAVSGAYVERPVSGLGIGPEQLAFMQPEIEAFGAEGIAPAAATVAPKERVLDRDKALQALAQYGGVEGLGAVIKATEPQTKDYLTVEGNVYERTTSGLKPVITSGGKFTGDFGNVALGLYGTTDANKILSQDPNAFKSIESRVFEKAKAGAGGQATEGERRAGFLANRVKFGLEQMAEVIGRNAPAASPEALPTVVNFLTGSEFLTTKLTSSDRRRIENAQIDILDAALTLGTGAAYTREQLDGYRKAYFPQLGEDEQAVRDKQLRLQNLLESAYTVAGRAAPTGAMPKIPSPQPKQPSSELTQDDLSLINKHLKPKR